MGPAGAGNLGARRRMSTSRKPASSGVSEQVPVYVVPRAWLGTLVVLAIVPWIVVGAVYFWSGPEGVPAGAAPVAQPARAAATGPWGRITRTSIVISPPLELIADDWGREPEAGKYWFFPETGMAAAERFLASTGLTPGQVSELLTTARPEPRINGLVMLPSPGFLLGIAPEIREKLYTQLAGSALNVNIAHAFRYAGTSADDWLGRALIEPSTRRAVEPLIHHHGRHVYLADVDLVRTLVEDVDERRRLAKAFMRQATVRARLEVQDVSEVPGLVTYWGRGGRRTDIRPLIESVVGAGADQSIDLIHLLPAVARENLYRYPRRTALDFERPALANCLWTALNFFEAEADDRYLDVGIAVKQLKEDYYLVQNGPEFGDIIVMVDDRGNIFHAVNYIADDLVFTKNGVSPLAPWVILPLDMVIDYYRTRSEKPQLLYHRRKVF